MRGGVTVEVGGREIVAMLGRNGAGKTTLLRSVIGLTPARSGRIVFNGHDVTRRPTYEIAALGVSYVPQGKHIFPRLSVAENLRLGTRLQRASHRVMRREGFSCFPVLEERLAQPGGEVGRGGPPMPAVA